MPIHTIPFIKKEEVAVGTVAFYFQKSEGFNHRAGNTIDLTLIDPPETDAEGNMRTFSIAAAPFEEHLMIATRMRDTAFKHTLKDMQPGTEVSVEGPLGSFFLHNNAAKPAVFLAGGIGITPFRSMSIQAAHEQLPHKIHLFYSNRRPEDAPFLAELQALEAKNPNFRLVATMTDMEKSTQTWRGPTGYITGEMIKQVPEYQNAIFYIAGPAAMVAGMYKILQEIGIDTDNIKTDEFAGY